MTDAAAALSPASLAAARAICDAATPGPWTRTGTDVWAYGAPKIVAHGKNRNDDDRRNVQDVQFIALARTLLPLALAEVERLRDAYEREKGECDTWRQIAAARGDEMVQDGKRLEHLWSELPFPMRHRWGGDFQEMREGIDAAIREKP